MKLTEVVLVDKSEDDAGHYCIPSPCSHGSMTLCGWVDVSASYYPIYQHKPNCPTCLQMLEYCKKLRVPK